MSGFTETPESLRERNFVEKDKAVRGTKLNEMLIKNSINQTHLRSLSRDICKRKSSCTITQPILCRILNHFKKIS